MKKITKNIFNEKILDKNSIIYLYGCTEIAEATIQGLKVSGKLVTGVIDKNSDLKPKDLMGVPIFNPTILKSISKDSLFLITCSYFNSVSKKLEEEGFYNIYDCALIIVKPHSIGLPLFILSSTYSIFLSILLIVNFLTKFLRPKKGPNRYCKARPPTASIMRNSAAFKGIAPASRMREFGPSFVIYP